ncbi:hypothetical protein CIL03_02325 [Virgibacillus indicus]|uniref:Uncharacterized protein n=1 Tax=Virgibacillus indicus TaxID=2024554 RepID=A0A265ND72_9BACI|nr:SA1362 family protein [Virgibacillus indicus]OZU89992.1 hypothetical protein CIL03_02325 [Virgibacillus indicus]
MNRKKISLFVYVIIGLALVGLISQLFTNTANFLTNILIMLGVAAAVFAVIYFVFLRKPAASNDMNKYKKAVKQSKAKYKNQNPGKQEANSKKQKPGLPRKRSKRASHLRVIDGNKNKRKDRASL